MMYPIVAQHPEGMRAEIMEYPLNASQTVRPGSLIRLDADGDCDAIVSADPTPILGFSLSDNTSGLVLYENTVLVALAKPNTYYAMRANATLTQDMVGDVYGLVLVSSEWKVDISDTTNTRVYVHEVFIDRQLAIVSVLDAHRQIPPHTDAIA